MAGPGDGRRASFSYVWTASLTAKDARRTLAPAKRGQKSNKHAAVLGPALVTRGQSTGGGGQSDALIHVGPIDGATTEAGGQASFSVRLSAVPQGDVTIHLSSSDAGEGTVTPASVSFTPSNFDAPQTVLVTGVDDDVADGAATYV